MRLEALEETGRTSKTPTLTRAPCGDGVAYPLKLQHVAVGPRRRRAEPTRPRRPGVSR